MKVETAVYQSFKGVDKANPETGVSSDRSPYAPNLIAGNDGFPEKRLGWRVMHAFDEKVYAITTWEVSGTEYVLAHSGTALYYGDGVTMTAMSGAIAEPTDDKARTQFFSFGGELFFLGAGNFKKISVTDGVFGHADVKADAYTPTILISRDPSGGGTTHEGVNLLSAKRKVAFLADGTSKVYQLPQEDITSVDKVVVGTAEKTAGTDYTTDLTAGTVTFTVAPPKAETYPEFIEGQDTVFITYSKTNADYVAKIENCSIVSTYGYGNTDRVVLSGNPDYRNTDWMSGYNDPTYWPDTSYANIGAETTAIMGYAHIGKYLAVLKEESNNEGTVFFRSYSMDSNSKPVFPVEQSITGVGMIARNTVANIDDEPLFLSRQGVCAICTSSLKSLTTIERRVQNRSWFVNNDIAKESALDNAAAVSWQNKYLLAINGNVYVMDGNQNHTYIDKTNGDFVYECYTWAGIPAFCLYSKKDSLYFGTTDGKLCKFNTDVNNLSRFSDGGAIGENGFINDGAAITAVWATKADSDGDFMTHKTMLRQGCGVMAKPYTRSSAAVTLKTDADFGTKAFKENIDIFDWEYIDFERMTFVSTDSPQVIPLRWKVRNYITLQIIVKNDAIDEGFGVLGISKRFTRGRYVR